MATSSNSAAAPPPPEWVARFVDDIPTGVAVFDRELRYVAANPAWIARVKSGEYQKYYAQNYANR